jgi:biopolymer transport protein ExbB
MYRLVILAITGKKMRAQMENETASDDNPLGRVLSATEQSSAEDTATLELILDEAITREVPIAIGS